MPPLEVFQSSYAQIAAYDDEPSAPGLSVGAAQDIRRFDGLGLRDQLALADGFARRGLADPRIIAEAATEGVGPRDGSPAVLDSVTGLVTVSSTSYPGAAQVDLSAITATRLFVRPILASAAPSYAISFDGAADALIVDSVSRFAEFSWSGSPPTELYLRALAAGDPFAIAVCAIEEAP